MIKKYSLGFVLFGAFLVFWCIQTFAGYMEVITNEQVYFWTWLRTTMENWQSEFLQLGSMVVLLKYFRFEGSPQSRDSSDRLEAKVDKVLDKYD